MLTNNEDPSPAAITTNTAHLPDCSSKQASKGTGQAGGRKEERVAFLCLMAFVPPVGCSVRLRISDDRNAKGAHGNEIK